MPKILPPGAPEALARDGYWFPQRVLPAAEAAAYRAKLEAYERGAGGPISSNQRHKVYPLFTWAHALVTHLRIFDAAEDLLGPNLLCWTTSFFIKEPRDPGFVSWHQDSTYWGLEPHDVVTARLALLDSPVESGAMKFVPGSHTQAQLPHIDTFHKDNLLSRGQEVAVDVDEREKLYLPLKAGEISLHNMKLVHGSKPNTTGDRRIGLTIR